MRSRVRGVDSLLLAAPCLQSAFTARDGGRLSRHAELFAWLEPPLAVRRVCHRLCGRLHPRPGPPGVARASPPRPRPIVLTPLREHAQPSRGTTPAPTATPTPRQAAALPSAVAPVVTTAPPHPRPPAPPTPGSPEGGQPFLPPSVSTLPACGFWGDGDLRPRAWGWPTAAPGDRGGWQCLSRWPGARVRGEGLPQATAAAGLGVPEGGALVTRTHLSAGASAAPLEASRRCGSAPPVALGGGVWAGPMGRGPDSPRVLGDTDGPQAGLGKAGHPGVGAGSAPARPAVGPSRQTGGCSCRPAHQPTHCALCRAVPWGSTDPPHLLSPGHQPRCFAVHRAA